MAFNITLYLSLPKHFPVSWMTALNISHFHCFCLFGKSYVTRHYVLFKSHWKLWYQSPKLCYAKKTQAIISHSCINNSPWWYIFCLNTVIYCTVIKLLEFARDVYQFININKWRRPLYHSWIRPFYDLALPKWYLILKWYLQSKIVECGKHLSSTTTDLTQRLKIWCYIAVLQVLLCLIVIS